MTKPRTLFEKIWDSHVVDRQEDGTCVLYIDRHLVHEVTSPQAFEGLRSAGRVVRRPEATFDAWYYRTTSGGVAAVYFRDGIVFAAEESSHVRISRLGS